MLGLSPVCNLQRAVEIRRRPRYSPSTTGRAARDGRADSAHRATTPPTAGVSMSSRIRPKPAPPRQKLAPAVRPARRYSSRPVTAGSLASACAALLPAAGNPLLGGEARGIEAGHHVRAVRKAAAEIAKRPDTRVAPRRRHDHRVNEGPLDAVEGRRLVTLVDDADRHEHHARAQVEARDSPSGRRRPARPRPRRSLRRLPLRRRRARPRPPTRTSGGPRSCGRPSGRSGESRRRSAGPAPCSGASPCSRTASARPRAAAAAACAIRGSTLGYQAQTGQDQRVSSHLNSTIEASKSIF